MSACCHDYGAVAGGQFTDEIAERDRKRYKRKGPNPTTRLLRNMVLRAGGGRTLLDVGGGVGALCFELLAAGFEQATIVDASPAYLKAARNESQQRGEAVRMTLVEGDFVSAGSGVPSADVVAMDRVICCYPQLEPLLDEAFRHSSRVCALSFPRNLWHIRLVVALQNAVRAMSRNAFRVYLHPAKSIEALAAKHGFQCTEHGGTFVWSVRTYVRHDTGSAESEGSA